MDTYTLQLIMLAGAYVLAGLLVAAAGTLSAVNYRSSKRAEARKSVVTRVTTLEQEVNLLRDSLDRWVKRENKREWSSRKKAAAASAEETEAEQPPPVDRDSLVAEFNQGRRS